MHTLLLCFTMVTGFCENFIMYIHVYGGRTKLRIISLTDKGDQDRSVVTENDERRDPWEISYDWSYITKLGYASKI